ncbi:RHS repeat-associated core domain-containing protein [Pseudomonas abietaniphila]|uniref:Insecticidal toxin complex protein TccC n=1 Tax=Pseudomonas abietaniphila TaxID=89065 RepID=A0A1G8FBG6_9PSED|nr:RHS repeat-associated core domain-containing protein [Pseudomonas abietaniphila]SDH79309.1 insecticidal toxin complex protein TccC [Pseudomonas abietaniphila]
MPDLDSLHTHTPTLAVVEPRGLPVRSVSFHRAQPGGSISERVDRSAFDVHGRLIQRWDPRLGGVLGNAAERPANLKSVHSLTGRALFVDSVDAGWSAELLNEVGQRDHRWNARGHWQRVEYDSLLRPSAVFEGDDTVGHCAERLAYGGANDAFANQCGQLIQHDDPAGSVANRVFSLTGEVIEQTRRFVKDLSVPDWPVLVSERDAVLEPGEGAKSIWRFGPLGDALEQTDAMGTVQAFAYTVAGQLTSTDLQLRGQSPQTLVSDIAYDAQGRITSETAGNGVITALDYDPVDSRLIRLRADNGCLQDLNYAYDPVGNVLQIEDLAQPVRHFANQQVEPLRTFAYDTLYQLIEATGYEAKTMNRGPANDAFRTFIQADELGSYTQRYEYDAAGNLQTLTHTGAQGFTRRFATASTSNRSVLQTADQPPSEEQIAEAFDANGNLRALQPGQTLQWDVRNQLTKVTPVERESGINDSEVYRYDAAGLRVRKVRTTQARTVTHLNEVRYLPGLEIRTNTATGEVLHVITATAGRSDVRVLHWQAGKPETLENDQVRYSLSDHLGSSTLELSADGELISQEIYYPYGETAWFAGRGDVEVSYKTLRYSGKERDATGLYYYGLRYYAPWLMRWINPDPAGERGGLNLFVFAANRPLFFVDPYGLKPEEPKKIAIGISNFPQPAQMKMRQVLQLSKDVLDFVTSRPASMEQQTAINEALTSSFGSDRPAYFDHELNSRLIEMRRLLDRLDSDQERWLELAELPASLKGHASSVNTPGDRSISLAQWFLEKGHSLDVAKTLIHETSHVVHHTRDFAYVDSKLETPGEGFSAQKKYIDAFKKNSQKLLSKGPNEKNMNPLNVAYYEKVISKYSESPLSSDRKRVFRENNLARLDVLLNNADSVATFAVIAWHQGNQPKAFSRSQPGEHSWMRSSARRFSRLFK